MAPGSLPRTGSQLYYAEGAARGRGRCEEPGARHSRSPSRRAAISTSSTARRATAPSGKGNGLVAAQFVTPADLTNPDLQKGRTDGYWQSYLSVGGAVMPSYGESLSAEERWHVVNYLRTLAAK